MYGDADLIIPAPLPSPVSNPGYIPLRFWLIVEMMKRHFGAAIVRDLRNVDTFAGRAAICKAFRFRNLPCVALDIERDERDVSWLLQCASALVWVCLWVLMFFVVCTLFSFHAENRGHFKPFGFPPSYHCDTSSSSGIATIDGTSVLLIHHHKPQLVSTIVMHGGSEDLRPHVLRSGCVPPVCFVVARPF